MKKKKKPRRRIKADLKQQVMKTDQTTENRKESQIKLFAKHFFFGRPKGQNIKLTSILEHVLAFCSDVESPGPAMGGDPVTPVTVEGSWAALKAGAT